MAAIEDVERIAAQIAPLLAGQPPPVQGAVLAELLSMFVAGHHPQLREGVLTLHVTAVRALIPINAKIIRGE